MYNDDMMVLTSRRYEAGLYLYLYYYYLKNSKLLDLYFIFATPPEY